MKILVMDDQEAVRSVVKAMLERLGHDVEEAENGEQTMNMYQESLKNNAKFDVIIMDLTVPGGMGGKETVKEILKLDSEANVIVSSGYTNDPILADYKRYGFCDVIVKPYHLKELSSKINQIQCEPHLS